MTISPNLLHIFNLIFLSLGIPLILYFFYVLFKYVSRDIKTYDNIYQYKIKSYGFTIFCVFFYFFIFIILIIILRIYYINNTLDLKIFLPLIDSFCALRLIFKVYLVIIVILILLLTLRVFLIIDSFFMKELLKIHIYFYTEKDISFYDKLYTFFSNMNSENDIITYYLRRCIFWCDYVWSNTYTKLFYKCHFVIFHSKVYKILFNFSPLWIIIFDCYFHNFILMNIYPYLVFFIPINLIKRISKKTLLMEYIIILLHEIYYNNNNKPNSIYLTHIDYYPLLEEYIKTQFAFNPLFKDINQKQLGYEFDLCFDMYNQSNFILYDENDARYINAYDVKVKKVNGKYLQLIYDEDKRDLILSDEEWILL